MKPSEPKKKKRSFIGNILLWLFYLFCIYAVFCLFKLGIGISETTLPPGSEVAVRAGEIAGSLVVVGCVLFICSILGFFAWLTRAK